MKQNLSPRTRRMAALAAVAMAAMLAGCPTAEYDLGFTEGFADDTEYWYGYWDSWDTLDGSAILYDGDNIPYIDDNSYDAGYWDGVWWAYNDGYYSAYRYAFAIGFSEGYDIAFNEGWDLFLAVDSHPEWLDGGFSDGYHDGFSEGRIFGAWEYDAGWDFNWLAALLDYWDGVDVELPALGLGTGEFGPVLLYEYGVSPFEVIGKRTPGLTRKEGGSRGQALSRRPSKQLPETESIYRPLTVEAEAELNVLPAFSPRSNTGLLLTTTWLERVRDYAYEMGAVVKEAPPTADKQE